jgi:transcriptional regulator with XRE-family HTH domain
MVFLKSRQFLRVTVTLRKILGKNVKKRRLELGYTQEQLALKCRMHDNYISKVELAKISVGVDNIERIAKALGVKPSILLD